MFVSKYIQTYVFIQTAQQDHDTLIHLKMRLYLDFDGLYLTQIEISISRN